MRRISFIARKLLLQLQADASLLRQMLHNLISNAIKYNMPDGWIRIGSSRWKHSVEVPVECLHWHYTGQPHPVV